MFVFGNLISAIAVILNQILRVYSWVIILRVILSWANADPYNTFVQIIMKLTEPVLYPIRKRMGLYNVGIDFSPLIVLFIIYFLQLFFISTLLDLAARLG